MLPPALPCSAVVPGHSGELYFLAFDHRQSFAREVLGAQGALSTEQVARVSAAKRIVFDGLLAAVEAGALMSSEAGVLVDEQFGGEVPRLALERGMPVAIAIERSGQDVFQFEHGDEFRQHLYRARPSFAKALVRHNVAGDAAGNGVQLTRLKALSDFLAERECKLLYELLVPPTDDQLASVGGDRRRYEVELRPALIAAGMRAAQESGIEPDVWKIEGAETAGQADALAAQARSAPGRERVACVVLGAGAPQARVRHWVEVAAATEGYAGFAIGRSIWKDPVLRHLAGELDRTGATRLIAERFTGIVETWKRARAN